MTILENLNPAQQEAVQVVDGPVLVLAGPGSGKTRVLTHRVAYLIHDVRIPPHNILAVTFTNKAAREMKDRLTDLVGEERVRELTVGTFHATCARFLRIDGERLGLGRDFNIFDEDDQAGLIKSVLQELHLDDKRYKPGAVLGAISRAKNEMVGPDEYAPPTYWHEAIRRIYPRYQAGLQANNAVDFDDLLNLTVRLFREHPDVLARYQRRYTYLHVDEFQDTNLAQFALVKLLAEKFRNLFCVGDEDQSIYGWRGADYRNVLRFQEDFPEGRVLLLEQNYRSTQTILDVAQAVIRRNRSRHEKKLWTENPPGVPTTIYEAYDEREEAQYVVDEIRKLIRQGHRPGDFAVFYRTNAQSRTLEEAFTARGVKYQVVGSLKFYERREVKDVIAFLRFIRNPNDGFSLNRILNIPPRGIGKTTHDDLKARAERMGVSPYSLIRALQSEEESSDKTGRKAQPYDTRARRALLNFAQLAQELTAIQPTLSLTDFMNQLVTRLGMEEYYNDGTAEGEDRWNNVLELIRSAGAFEHPDPNQALGEFLEHVALVSDVDELEGKSSRPVLMTLHMAKGLEFPVVFIVGMEEELFPHARAMEDEAQMEEERRLCYVGITRARERLYLVHAFRRSRFGGGSVPSEPSRFLADIPRELVQGTARDKPEIAARRTFEWKETPPPLPKAGHFKAGDRVRHRSFGDGIVISSQVRGDDEQVQVAFAGKGVKSLLNSMARLEKI